jgi:predicted nucleic acid-binding protein
VILVDADVLIDFFAGKEPGATAVHRLLEERQAAISSITVFELLAGVTGKKRIAQIEALAAIVQVVELSADDARIAAAIYTTLKAKGRLIGNQDLFLAATALGVGIPVLTRNRDHFARVAELRVLSPGDL